MKYLFEVDEEELIFERDASGKVIEIQEEKAVALMLADELLFCNSILLTDGTYQLVLYVNCSDIFAWGFADAEKINMSGILDLFNFYLENKETAAARWCCIKRNEQPQKPIKEWMIKEGAWDTTMESLLENQYDKRCRESQTTST